MSALNKALITVAAILLIMGLLKLNNNRKLKRGFQYPFLILCPVIVVAEVLALILLRNEIWQWLNQQSWASWAYSSIMQAGSDLFGIELLVLNAVIAVPYTILKLILRPVLTAFMKRGQHMRIAEAYTWDEDFQHWYLKEDRTGLRGILRGIIWITAILTCAVCGVGWIMGPGSDYWFYAFPAAALVILMEFLAYFCGLTREEFIASVGGEGIRSAASCQYNKLRQIYEKLFPESLLSSRTGKDFQARSGATQLLKELSESSDQTDRFVGEYYLHLRHRKPGSFNVDLINASNKLLHHESTIIFNPFYRDMSDYITLPVADTLLNGEKVLVIVGRQSTKENVARWMEGMLGDYCRTDRLWQVAFLADRPGSCDVGMLAFSDLYNLDVINHSEEFFRKVGFILLVEPSRMLTTSQAGLSIVVGKFDRAKQPTFCALDHELDGLVDLLSHIFQQNVTNVFAAPAIQPTYTAMGWNAAGDYKRQSLFQQQTHFLGNGTELAAVALKYQVNHVDWYSEEKAPVADIRWIAEQYYPQISRYAGLPYEQKSIEDHICFSPDLWERPVTENSFIITEDETCNLFATLRAYLSRGKKQSFVHAFSENYLLRDYMRFNWQLFMSDAKAIPMLAPHYAKTERNTVLRLVILMASAPVSQKYIEQELQLLGYDGEDCYRTLSNLISRYTVAKETIITVSNHVEDTETLPVTTQMYSIPKRQFDLNFASTLKNAFFVVEDEELGSQYIDARMFGQITQLVMPGQQVVYGGKLYKVHSISPRVGCILHRASDEYMRRLYYRQLRTYTLEDRVPAKVGEKVAGKAGELLAEKSGKSTEQKKADGREVKAGSVISCRRVGEIEITVEDRSFSVISTGYLEMKDLNDLSSARFIDLKDDPNVVRPEEGETGEKDRQEGQGENPYYRVYKHKAVMTIRLPDADAAARYTLTLLISELMHTLFPYSWPYIAVMCKKPEGCGDKAGRFLYDLEGDADGELIYILEDSAMDLGLLEAIDNNLFRILEIVADYLNWHEEKRLEMAPSPAPETPDMPEAAEPEKVPDEGEVEIIVPPAEERKKRKGLAGLIDAVFGKRKKKKKPEGKNPAKEPEKQPEGEKPAEGQEAPGTTVNPGDPIAPDALNDPDNAGAEDAPEIHSCEKLRVNDDFTEGKEPEPRATAAEYAKTCFLKFGSDGIDPSLDVDGTRKYLNDHGFGENHLLTARKGADPGAVKLEMDAECYCDFCGKPLNGVSYERLADGRIRCQGCASSAINEVSEFTDVFFATLALMEDNYHITYHVPISIRIADAKTIARLRGRVFVPTSGYDGRVVGFAQQKGNEYTLYVENGSPRLATIATTAHEMTHIWQYLNWNRKKIKALYRTDKERDIVYEGMASWTEIQTLYMIGEYTYAQEQEQILAHRALNPDDVYGIGFLRFCEKYGMGRQGDIPVKNPFNTYPPL